MVSVSNYLKAKKLTNNNNNNNNNDNNDNNNNNNNNDNNSNNNDTYPTITIIESKNVPVDDEQRKRCFIIPERAFIAVVFSLHLFFGILITSAAFMSLALSSKPSDQAQYAINGVLFAFLGLNGIIGLTALKNENAILMRRLSISFWILAALMLIFNVTIYILRVVSKPEYVQNCQANLDQSLSEDKQKQFNLDCDKIVNHSLIRCAIQLLIVEAISIYFAYAVACYSRKLITKSNFQSKFNNQKREDGTGDVFTYKIQTTNLPPTSDRWAPPRYSSDNQI